MTKVNQKYHLAESATLYDLIEILLEQKFASLSSDRLGPLSLPAGYGLFGRMNRSHK